MHTRKGWFWFILEILRGEEYRLWENDIHWDPRLEFEILGCYEPFWWPCERAQFSPRSRSSRPPTTTRTHHYLAHRSFNHAIAIAPIAVATTQSLSRHRKRAHRSGDHALNPLHTSGVITPVATARSPIARSLIVSIYRDHLSIPTPILVLALNS
jgi:hypothetical protein